MLKSTPPMIILMAGAILMSIQLSTILADKVPTVKKSIVGNFTDCGSEGEILQVQIPGCSDPPCDFTVGQDIKFGIYFKSKSLHKNLRAFSSVTVADTETTLLDLTTAVDVEPGQISTFAYFTSVKESMGQGAAVLRVTVGEDKVNELCVLVAANLHK